MTIRSHAKDINQQAQSFYERLSNTNVFFCSSSCEVGLSQPDNRPWDTPSRADHSQFLFLNSFGELRQMLGAICSVFVCEISTCRPSVALDAP